VANWYAVYTKPRLEAVAEENLDRQGFEVYFPRCRQARLRRGKWTGQIEPLFPRYLFVRVSPGTDNVAPVRSTKGVVGFVRFGGEPKAVPDALIDALRANEERGSGFHATGALFSKGDNVRMLTGPFAGWQGIFLAQTGEERVMVLLSLMGRENKVAVPIDSVAPAA